MKWLYLPTIFSLAFFYAKLSFVSVNDGSHTLYIKDKAIISRGPASTLDSQVSSHDLSSSLDHFKSLKGFTGVVWGELGVGDFGFIFDDRKKIVFSVNELEKIKNGFFYEDVMAHLANAKRADKKIKWIDYFEFYKKGLQGKAHTYSYYVEKGFEGAYGAGQSNFKVNVAKNIRFNLPMIKSEFHALSALEFLKIKSELLRTYPNAEIFDLLADHEESIYQALIRFKVEEKVQWVEFFQLKNLACPDESTTKGDCWKSVLDKAFDGHMGESFKSVDIKGRHFIIKSNDNFALSLQMSDVPLDDFRDVIMDQAYELGRHHKRFLGERSQEYIKEWAQIPSAIIDEKAVELKYQMIDEEEYK